MLSRMLVGQWVAMLAGVAERKLGRLAAVAALGLAAFSFSVPAIAGPVFTGQFGTGNTWNMYEAINTSLTFKEALALASTRPDPTGGNSVGHLVTLLSQAENNFVQTNASGNRWIGLSDRVGVAPGAMESQFMADPLTEGWKWVTGEPFGFQAWGSGEPNNAGTGEDAVHLRGDNLWNDHQSGFDIDQPVADFDSTAEGLQAFPFVIEWSKNVATMPNGFPTNRPDPPAPPIARVFPTPLARLPGPNGTATALGVREVRDIGANSGSITQAITDILSGSGTIVNGTAARFDIIDPDTNAGTGGSVAGPTVPIISDQPGIDDNQIQSIIKATVRVPAGQGGDYTFNVRSDDGMALRILSQASGGPLTQHKFTNSRNGRVDEDGALVFAAPTGDSNTQGLINLAPGTYDVEFVVYEDGGGAFWEVSTQKGDFINPPANTAANWVLLGDGTSVPQNGPFPQVARLTGNATVLNYDGTVTGTTVISEVVSFLRSNTPPTAQGTVADVVLNGDNNQGIHGNTVAAGQVHQFPNGSGIDFFSTAVTGQIQVLDTDGAAGETLTFGMFADDNAALHITGRDFTAAGGGGTILDVESTGDDWLVADFRTGDTNAYGTITLPEGNYNFEAFQLEEGGGAALELFVAAGNRSGTGFNSAFFFPLTTATVGSNVLLSANQGLGLVAGPGTGPAAGQTGDFNGNGVVDAADYVLWRNGGPLQNEGGVTTGTATPEDYQSWRTNFGRTPGTGAATAVPEASTIAFSLIAALLGLAGGRARRT